MSTKGRTIAVAKQKKEIVEKVDKEVVEMVEEVETKTVPKTTKKKARVYEADELIPCRSITSGKLLVVGRKTGLLMEWSGFGDVNEVEYQDLLSMATSKSSELFMPRIMIEDEEVLEVSRFKPLIQVYEEYYANGDIEDIFDLSPERIKEVLATLPETVQNNVKNMAADKIHNGTLDSISKVKAIDSVLGTELILFIN